MKKLKKMESPCKRCETRNKCKLSTESCVKFHAWALKSWKELREFFLQFKEGER